MRSLHSGKIRMAAVGAPLLAILLLAALLWRELRESIAGVVLDQDVGQPAAVIFGMIIALLVLFAARARGAPPR